MSDPSQSLSLIDSLSSLKHGLTNGDPLSRLQALETCRKLQAELENPGETLLKITWAEVGKSRATIHSNRLAEIIDSQPTTGSFTPPKTSISSVFYRKTMKRPRHLRR